jgi:NYN domain
MLAYAIDNQAPATIVLISGDRDFAYAVSILRLRNYRVVVVAPPIIHASLKSQASILVDWNCDILAKIEADAELAKTPSFCANERNFLQSSSRSAIDQNIPSASSYSLAGSMMLRPAELTVDVEPVGQTALLTVKRDSDDPQDGLRNGVWAHKIPQWHADGSTASVPDTKLQSSAHTTTKYGSFSSTDSSPLQTPVFGKTTEPLTAGCTGGVMSPLELDTPTSELTSAPGQLIPIPRTFEQTHVLSGRTSLSTANPKQEYRTSSSVFSSLGHHASTPEHHDNLRDHHLVSASNALASMPNANPLHSRISKTTDGGVALPSLSIKIPTAGANFTEPSDIAFGSHCNTAYFQSTSSAMSSSSNDSSLMTSLIVETCPSIIKTPQLTSACNPDGNHEIMTDDCGKTATVPPSENVTQEFHILIEQLELQQKRGVSHPLRSVIAEEIMKQDRLTYERSGVHTFKQYTHLALKAGIVIIGGAEGGDWISLHPALKSQLSSSSATESLYTQISGGEVSRECRASISIPECTGNPEIPSQGAALKDKTTSYTTENATNIRPSGSVSTIISADSTLPESHFADPIRMIGSYETDSKPSPSRLVPASHFEILVEELRKQRANGICRPSRSAIAVELLKQDNLVYKRAGVSRFKQYTTLAVEAGIAIVGGDEGDAWISLPPEEKPTSVSRGIVPSLPGLSDSTQQFQMLIEQLRKSRSDGVQKPLRSLISQRLVDHNQMIYKDAGFKGFKDYSTAAEIAGFVQLGGIGGSAWISLC